MKMGVSSGILSTCCCAPTTKEMFCVDDLGPKREKARGVDVLDMHAPGTLHVEAHRTQAESHRQTTTITRLTERVDTGCCGVASPLVNV